MMAREKLGSALDLGQNPNHPATYCFGSDHKADLSNVKAELVIAHMAYPTYTFK